MRPARVVIVVSAEYGRTRAMGRIGGKAKLGETRVGDAVTMIAKPRPLAQGVLVALALVCAVGSRRDI